MNRRELLKSSGLFVGYAISSATLTSLFISCQAEAKLNLDWKPVFLSKEQANMLAEITETILPKTKTPGAKELAVPQFIDKMLKEVSGKADQTDFVVGLAQMDKDCTNQYGKSFVECTPEDRIAFLLTMDEAAGKFPPSVWGITLAPPSPVAFFRKLKSLTLFGYYTSEEVGKNILSYDPVPGDYIACLPLKEVGNAWNE